MQPRLKKCWTCSNCGKPHINSERANQCCRCVHCGETTDGSIYCGGHKANAELRSWRGAVSNAEQLESVVRTRIDLLGFRVIKKKGEYVVVPKGKAQK